MNILDAIASGKPFKRKAWPEDFWLIVKNENVCFEKESMCDNDWITKSEPREFWVKVMDTGNGLAYKSPIDIGKGEVVIHVREIFE